MVSYQAFVSIYFETVQDRGAQINDISDGSTVMELAADAWNRNRRTLLRATSSKASDVALRHLRRQR